MDKLFTLYDTASATPTVVTTANGTLAWKYVASGLTAGSGQAGQLANGRYFVQLDNNGGGASGGGVETVLMGDANLDDKVDINDLSRVLTNYDNTGAMWSSGDFNGDGRVDINDLSVVLTNYDHSYGSSVSGVAAVPEPSVLVLVALGVAGLLAYSRRKRG